LRDVHDNLKDKIVAAFIEEVQKDRDNYKSDLDLLWRISEIFAKIFSNENKDNSDTYLFLSNAIVEDSRLFYLKKFSEWSESCSCEDYILNIKKLQEEETVRFDKCLTKFSDTQKQISTLFN